MDSKSILKWALPIILLAGGFGLMQLLSSMREPPAGRDDRVEPPAVTVVTVNPTDQPLEVVVNGVVRPVTESTVTAMVGGTVTWVAPWLTAGGTFPANAPMVRIDPRDYQTSKHDAEAMAATAAARLASAQAELARLATARESAELAAETAQAQIGIAEADLTSAAAAIAAARADLSRTDSEISRAAAGTATAATALASEQAMARLAVEEWRKFGDGKEPPDLVARKPQLAEAEARLASARSDEQAARQMKLSAEAGLASAEAARESALKRLDVAKIAARSASKGVELVDRQRDSAQAAIQMANAEAQAAAAAIARAELNLSRTEITTPFAGRVVSYSVGLGQQLAPGTPIAMVYATEMAEITVPVPVAELAYLDLPIDGTELPKDSVPVKLTGKVGGKQRSWTGWLHRSDSQIDPITRVLNMMVRVDAPVGPQQSSPLIPGMFVTAHIPGRTVPGVTRLHRMAVRNESPDGAGNGRDTYALIVTRTKAPEGAQPDTLYGTLSYRKVDILRYEGREVLVSDGLAAGEEIAVTGLEVVTEGMLVRLLISPAPKTE